MSITIKDIAKLAGVSRGTVDRALNNRGRISPEVKEKILKIASDNGYQKNVAASSLAKNKKIKIAIVLPNPELDVFWEAPLNGINSIKGFVQNYGMDMSFHYFDLKYENSYCSAMESAIESKPKAILVAPVFLKESQLFFRIAQQNDIPFVCINSEFEHKDVLCYVGQNSYQCGMLAGRLFDLSNPVKKTIVVLTLGHKVSNAIHIEKKVEGLSDFNKQNDSTFDIKYVAVEDFTNPEIIRSVTESIIKDVDNLHGIFFTNSRSHKFLNNNQLFAKYSKDIVIVGFDLLEENIEYLKKGDINFLLNQNPLKQGYLGVMNLFNYFVYNKEIPLKRYLPVDVVVAENYPEYLNQKHVSLELVI